MDAGSSPTEVRMMRYDFDSSAVSQFGPITLLFHYFKIVLSFIYNYIYIYIETMLYATVPLLFPSLKLPACSVGALLALLPPP